MLNFFQLLGKIFLIIFLVAQDTMRAVEIKRNNQQQCIVVIQYQYQSMLMIYLENKKQTILKLPKLLVLSIYLQILIQTKAISRLLEFFRILYLVHQMKKIQQQIKEVEDQTAQLLIIKAIIKQVIDFLCLPKPSYLQLFGLINNNNIILE